MIVDVPVYVESHQDLAANGTLYRVEPLFFDFPSCEDAELWKATTALTGELTKLFRAPSSAADHRRLAEYVFLPELELHRIELRLELRADWFRVWAPVVVFPHFDRQLAFSPRIRDCWFELHAGESLADRAAEVYRRYFRELEKNTSADEVKRRLAPFAEKKSAWITSVSVSVSTRLRRPRVEDFSAILLGTTEELNGRDELEKVGRRLDARYPDELRRALQTEALVEELGRLLQEPDHRPVLLVGPRLVGKTTLIHEVVYRRVRARPENKRFEQSVWLVSPQRLVSGMSYVGQWENRLLAILRHTRKKMGVLYFDDFLGMYLAGVHSASSLSAADVLRPHVERREVRILAEMTPEQWRVLRERDRGFADQFHVVPMEEPAEPAAWRILLGVMRSLEDRHRVRFTLDVLPLAVELTGRYQRDAAQPGKAARLLEQLAVKYQHADVTRERTLEAFREKSGLDLALLDSRHKLPRTTVVGALDERIIGQPPALEAMAEIVCLAKAGLNEAQRPLGSLLFLGPTGVGKTQCAKVLAAYLFGDETRLMRFDMNEFVSAQSVSRLVGTFDQPDGLLTGAIRRQPFAVVLFDEIEKAHPDVFDLLLQVLGEARLTDAHGRTVDFSSTVLILTSNLGTQSGQQTLGFDRAGPSGNVYLKAVEEFFRPEFVNRLDRIVAFAPLSGEDMGRIARLLLDDILRREGFVRRRFALELPDKTLEWLLERGHDPQLGARAMRRMLEKEVVQPAAVHLAAIRPDTPTVLSLRCQDQSVSVDVTELVSADPWPETARPDVDEDLQRLLECAKAALDRIEERLLSCRPPASWSAGEIPADHSWYLGVREFLRDLRRLSEEIQAESKARGRRPPSAREGDSARTANRGARQLASVKRFRSPPRRLLQELLVADDIHDYFRSLDEEALKPPKPGSLAAQMVILLNGLALLEKLAPAETGWLPQRAVVLILSLGDASLLRRKLSHRVRDVLRFGLYGDDWDDGSHFGPECRLFPGTRGEKADQLWWESLDDLGRQSWGRQYHLDILELEGHRACEFAALEQGTHLFLSGDGNLDPLQVIVEPCAAGISMADAVCRCLERHQQYRQSTPDSQHVAQVGEDPLRWQPVVAVYEVVKAFPLLDLEHVVDHRTAAIAKWPGSWRNSLATLLPLPPEFG